MDERILRPLAIARKNGLAAPAEAATAATNHLSARQRFARVVAWLLGLEGLQAQREPAGQDADIVRSQAQGRTS